MKQCNLCHSGHVCTGDFSTIKGKELVLDYCGSCGHIENFSGQTLSVDGKGKSLIRSFPKREEAQQACWGCDESTLESLHSFRSSNSNFRNISLKKFMKRK